VDFSSIFSECHLGASKDFYLLNQYLFKGKRLCLPHGFLTTSLIEKLMAFLKGFHENARWKLHG